ncbi:mitochondrial metalloendopeptidase OMA1 [Decorospora gaudefroyi]|uniref:Mitochondrial metalloendopeptidase OMA1 n=1 Tax=Decorospora gaudefroyi TaxID=184978 RepID=A0A6A5K390_9PLEO|nr:mitochondrial metalloendopeptidase OMA1 [Decorospora gaudefroyi]
MYRIRPPLRAFGTPLRSKQTHFHTSRPFLHHRTYKQHPFGRRPQYKRFNNASSGLSSLFYRWAARPTFYRDVGLVSLGTGAVYLYNIETVPVSGRRRFNIIPASLEATMGKLSVEQIHNEYKDDILPDHDPRVQQVKRVLERLLPYAAGEGLTDVEWEVTVIDSPEENAFVVPGGKVFVFTGILPLCGGEDGIAAVLGHEIAHVVAHHTAERMSHAPIILLGVIALTFVDVSLYSAKMIIDFLLSMPASRKHEAEADYIGLLMMAQGCYRPEAAMDFWARMEKSGQRGPPEILSTHPSNHNREEKIRGWLPEAQQRAEMSECAITSQYATQFGAAFDNFPRW